MTSLLAQTIPLSIGAAISPIVLMSVLAIIGGQHGKARAIAFAIGFVIMSTALLIVGALLFTRVPAKWPRSLRAVVRLSVAFVVLVGAMFALVLQYAGLLVVCPAVEFCANSEFAQQLVGALSVATLGSAFFLVLAVVPAFFLVVHFTEANFHHQRLAKNAH